jgi:thymidylate synthase (FAD)
VKIIKPQYQIMSFPDPESALALLEAAGRTCYKSEDYIEPGSAANFVRRITDSGHLSVIEHVSVTVRLICDRGVTHELVRHRLAAYSQESTRYANYSQDKFGKELTFIAPLFWPEGSAAYKRWAAAMQAAEDAYLALLKEGALPQEARSVLPSSLKTEIVMSANLREWLHVFKMRCEQSAHPQAREIMLPLLREFSLRLPQIFSGLDKQMAPEWQRMSKYPGWAGRE